MKHKPTAAEKKAIAALTKPQPGFGAFRTARAEEELRNAQPGQMIEGQGIFIGRWELKDKAGAGLSKTFNVFSAPQDLTDEAGNRAALTYGEARERIGGLKAWHGHDGEKYANEDSFVKALGSSKYKGGWIIPDATMLDGLLRSASEKGDLKDSFAKLNTAIFSGHYWTSTVKRDREIGTAVWIAPMVNPLGTSFGTWSDKGNLFHCRPVRLAECNVVSEVLRKAPKP